MAKLLITTLTWLLLIHNSLASSKPQYNSNLLQVTLTSRTPQQMAAFYEARGFQKNMLDKIASYCFITVYIKNKSNTIIYHDLSKWSFKRNTTKIKRLHRNTLKETWDLMNIPLAHQSTFRWTLLPEELDFQPGEREGGNIVLPFTEQDLSVKATFNRQVKNKYIPLIIQLNNVKCKK